MAERFYASGAAGAPRVGIPDPAAGRSGIGEGVEALGDALSGYVRTEAVLEERRAEAEHQVQQLEVRRARSAAIADGAARWAEVQGGLTTELEALRSKTAPGAPGYAEQAGELIRKRVEDFTATLGDDEEVTERFKPLTASFLAQAAAREDGWERDQRSKHEGDSFDRFADTLGVEVQRDPSAATLQRAFDSVDLIVSGMDMDGTTRAAVTQGKKERLTRAYLDGLLETGNHAGVKALLTQTQDGKGALDRWLDPEARRTFLARVGNAEAIQARAAEHAASAARDAARDAIKTIKVKQDAGVVVTPAELRAARAGAEAAGLDKSEVAGLDVMDITNAVNGSYGRWLGQPGGADRLRAERDRYAAIERPSERDMVVKAQLDRLVEKADDEEAEPLKELAKQGPAGAMAALSRLSGTPEARYERAEKIREGLGFLANLRPEVAQRVLEGEEIRKARKGGNGQADASFGTMRQVKAAADAYLGPLAVTTVGGLYDDLVESAWNHMVSSQAARGATGFSAEKFEAGLLAVTGAHVSNGRMVGGIQQVRGRPVALPEWMEADSFDRVVARAEYPGWTYANGRPIDKADLLAHYRPELAGTDERGVYFYRFVGAGGKVLTNPKTGNPYFLNVWP